MSGGGRCLSAGEKKTTNTEKKKNEVFLTGARPSEKGQAKGNQRCWGKSGGSSERGGPVGQSLREKKREGSHEARLGLPEGEDR